MRMDYRSRRYALLNTPIEVNRHVRRVERYLRPRAADRVLEIGCGRGFLTRQIQRIAPATTGIDLNPQAISNAVADDLRNMDARALAFPDAVFDKIYSFHAIEHIPDLGRAFAEMDRVLKPGGRVLLVYPAEPIRGLYVVPTALLIFGNPLRARDLHVHKLSPRTLLPFLAGTSLRVVRSKLQFLLTPQFITVLRKPHRVDVRRTRRPVELEARETV
ncbi:MAG TPA: methyltransferase domain-containing protein [Gemmatimonadaceae bacterium]|nr:methyltransferase domain-containing protein [Gemmatimonadaceae bacterium]